MRRKIVARRLSLVRVRLEWTLCFQNGRKSPLLVSPAVVRIWSTEVALNACCNIIPIVASTRFPRVAAGFRAEVDQKDLGMRTGRYVIR